MEIEIANSVRLSYCLLIYQPENIMLDSEGHVRLVDFNLSKRLPDNGRTSTFCGTPAFSAPELIAIGDTWTHRWGRSECGCDVTEDSYGLAIDWWSLGAVLHLLVLGHLPFTGNNRNQTFELIRHAPVELPNDLDPDCRSLLMGLLEKDPDER